MTKITISAHTVLYNSGTLPAFARVYCNQQFVNDDGETVDSGSVESTNYVKQVAVSNSSGVATIAAFSTTNRIDSSVDANGVTISTYALSLHSSSGALLEVLYPSLRIPAVPTSTTWAAIILFNQTHAQPPRHTYYDALQINALIGGFGAVKATDTDYGVTKLSIAAVDPADPIAAGINDPRVTSTIGTLSVAGTGTVSPAASNFQYETLRMTGVLTGDRTVNWPVTGTRQTITFWNDTTGDFDLFIKATPEVTATVRVLRGAQAILLNDGTEVIDITAAVSRIPFYCLEFDGTPASIDFGVFYPFDTDLGDCLYETYIKLLPGASSSLYDWSEGYGGNHAMLRNPFSGNIFKGGIITGATNATPIVVTTASAHGFTTGEVLSEIKGVVGNTAANGTNKTITVVSPTTFSINASVGNGAYVSGGIIYAYTVSFGADDVPYVGQWAHSATGVSDGLIVHYYDGVPVGKATFVGARMCPLLGGNGHGFMGGSDHQNLIGRLAQYRIFEGSNPQGDNGSSENLSAAIPEVVFGAQAVEGVSLRRANLLVNFYRPEQLIPDLSGGFPEGRNHPGKIRGTGFSVQSNRSSYPAPQYTTDADAPNALGLVAPVQPAGKVYTPATPPVGALVFDSIQRKNSTWTYDGLGGMGSTESGSLGVLPYIERDLSGVGIPTSIKQFGIVNEKGVPLAGFSGGNFARVVIAQTDLDIRVSRAASSSWGMGIATGIMFRYVDDANWCMAFTTGTLRTNQVLRIRALVAGSPVVMTGEGDALPSSWEVLRVLTKSNADYSVYADSTLIVTSSDASHAAGTGAGVTFGTGVGNSLDMRFRNFTVFTNP